MKYTIIPAFCSGDVDNVSYAIMEVTQLFLDNMIRYRNIALGIPEANYIVFRENNFYFVNSDFEEEFPELNLESVALEEGNVLYTNIDLSEDKVDTVVEVIRIECHSVKVYPNCEYFSFFAFNKYNSSEYFFEMNLSQIENALKND